MNEFDRLRLKQMRGICSTQGWTLLLYNLLMTGAVVVVMIIEMVIAGVTAQMNGETLSTEELIAIASQGGWGYFLAIGIGLLILLLWKKPKYVFGTLCDSGKPMDFSSFVMLFTIFIGVQGVFQILTIFLELWLNGMGFSILEGIESASGDTETFSMFLYVTVGAPIAEELLFRGFVLRSLEPMGKRFAIFTSALLFGLYHGNIVQIPFAFLVGLVLAYVTLEHSIWWAMVLHMFNNMVLGDTLTRILPEQMANSIIAFMIYGCFIAGIVLLIVNHKKIAAYFRSYRNDPLAYRAFFTSGGMITFLIYIVVNIIYTTYLLITPI